MGMVKEKRVRRMNSGFGDFFRTDSVPHASPAFSIRSSTSNSLNQSLRLKIKNWNN